MKLTATDRAVWRDYEAANARAAQQYVEMPLAFNHAGSHTPCDGCGRRTQSKSGMCRKCEKGQQ